MARHNGCPECGGSLFTPHTDEHGDVVYRPCACREQYLRDLRQERLMRTARLTGEQARYRLKDVWLTGHGRDPQAYRDAVSGIRDVIGLGGWLTLSGAFGVGKTFLLCAAVNEARDQGRSALYITLADFLAAEKATFDDDARQRYGRLWEDVAQADLLALDEVDPQRYHVTGWSQAEVFRLLNARYEQRERATVMATNNYDLLPEYLRSRIEDGRSMVVYLSGSDVRPTLRR